MFLFLILQTYFYEKTLAQNITEIEYFIDSDPGYGNGNAVPFAANPDISNLNFSVDVTSLSKGFHSFFVRSKDANGVWSQSNKTLFYKETLPNSPLNINYVEYFIDNDPGFGNGNSVPLAASPEINNLTFTVDVTSLSDGIHTLFTRSRDLNGLWTLTNRKIFFKETLPSSLPNVNYVEYFFDNDPGFGNANPVALTAGTDVQGLAFIADISALSEGFHNLFIRSRDENKVWSLTNKWLFYKELIADTLADIVKAEYFIDADPGFGMATNIPITSDTVVRNIMLNLDISSLNSGFHQLFIRTLDSDGKWSLTNKKLFYNEFIPSSIDVVEMEYFVDTDPGFGIATAIPISSANQIPNQNFTIDVSSFSDGFHTLFLRSKDNSGKWSLTNKKVFFKESIPSSQPIVSVEYFWDNDPGFGNGTDVPITANPEIQNLMFSADLQGLPAGPHTLFVRTQDSTGRWTLTHFTTPPYSIFLTCPANVVANADPNQCQAMLSIAAPIVSGATTITNTFTGTNDASGTYPVGITNVSYHASNLGGDNASCTFTVQVIDNQAPTITCPTNQTVTGIGIGCSVNVGFGNATGTDQCVGLVISRTSGLASGSAFPEGISFVEFTATDLGGNTTSCNFSIQVNCNLPSLSISCPANANVSNDLGLCNANLTIAAPTVNNGSGSETVSNDFNGTNNASGIYPVGNTYVVFSVVDGARTASCSFSVNVQDTENPTITCPAGFSVSGCSSITTFLNATGNDNCPGLNISQISGLSSGTIFPSGTNTITFRARDAASVFNQVFCSFDVIVSDDIPPTITCPANQTLTGTGFGCSVQAGFSLPNTNDNCAGVNLTQSLGFPSGSFFPEGLTTNVFIATDNAGNTVSCSFFIEVNCNLPPLGISNCAALNVTTITDINSCDAFVSIQSPTISNGSGSETISNNFNGTSNASDTYPLGNTNVIFTIVDGARTASCAFNVFVQDNQNPTISCPSDFTINVESAVPTCSSIVTFASAIGSDNCSVSISQIGGLSSGSVFSNGISTITYRASDGSGNIVNCSFEITVVCDVLPPLFIACPANVSALTAFSQCDANLTFAFPIVSNGSPSQVLLNDYNNNPSANDIYPLGTTTVNYTVQDRGRTATCSFEVLVVDEELPMIFCPGSLTVNGIRNGCIAIATFSVVSATDNCPNIIIDQISGGGLGSGSIYNDGTTNLSYRATDSSGNSSSCTFNVEVECIPAPPLSLVCPANISANNDLGNCNALVTSNLPIVLNGSGLETITNNFTAGLNASGIYPVGNTTVVYSVLDGIDLATCSFQVLVLDNEIPEITCPSTFMIMRDPANCPAIVTWNLISNDNCPNHSVNLISGMASGNSFPEGSYTSAFQVTDENGNTNSCSFEIFVACNPLPIQLIDFKGKNIAGINVLDWTSLEEINIDYFELQKSSDGINFKTIDRIQAKGENLSETNYQSKDENPFDGNNFYRLKIVEKDGLFEYSKIINIKLLNEFKFLKVYPIPFENHLNLEFSSAFSEKINLSIYNELGQIVLLRKIDVNVGLNQLEIDLSDFSSGVYQVLLKNESNYISQKIMKK